MKADPFQTRKPRVDELDVPTNFLGAKADVEMLTARDAGINGGES